MASVKDTLVDAGWAVAVRQRRKALMHRIGMGAAVALVFSPSFGWIGGISWVAGYYLVQFLEVWAFGPITSGRTEQMGPVRSIVGGVVLMLNAAYIGSLSLMLWAAGGAMGGICAAILLSSAAIYAVVNSGGSRLVLGLTLTPQFIYLALTPVLMLANGAEATFSTAVAIALTIFLGYCLSTWSRMEKARTAEASARLEAEAKRRDAEQAVESRGAFLATVGHDLRTPISAILAGATELERVGTDSASRSHARLIADAGLMMKALLDDLLDHAKLEAGRMTVEAADFDLRALLAQTVRLWQGPARAKGLKLRVEGAAGLPRLVRGDAMRLRQVLNNLVSNAMKFTDSGSITLRLSAWAEEPTGHAVVIDVADTGPGMTREQVQQLFTPFGQAEGVSHRYGGTGLGLAISRHLAELMGGRLTARSRLGEGACFTLALSFAPAEASAVAAPAGLEPSARDAVARALSATALAVRPSAADPQPQTEVEAPVVADAARNSAEEDEDGRALRVLIVDDHDINRRAIELVLQPLGCETASAENGVKALELCQAAAFDVIFMDVRMPELDGRETTRRLRASAGPNQDAPVIAVTADTAPEDITACTAAGMTYFVPKPISPAALLNALQHVLSAEAEEVQSSAAAA